MSDNQTPNIPQDRGPKYARRYRIIWQAVKNLTEELGQAPERKQVIKEIIRIGGDSENYTDDLHKKHLCSAGLMDDTVAKVWKFTKEGEALSLEDLDDKKCFEILKLWGVMRISTSGVYKPIIKFLRDLDLKTANQDEIIKHIRSDLNLNDDEIELKDKKHRSNPISPEFRGNSKFRYLVIEACKELSKKGIIEKEGEVWRLTEKGKKEGIDILLKSASEKLEETASSRSTSSSPLDLALTYKTIWEAACKRQYVTYNDIAKAHDKRLGIWVISHMQRFLRECYQKNLPILGVMVVADDAKESGELAPGALAGTIRGARDAGYHEAHLLKTNYQAEQEKVFKWAKTAPSDWEDIPLRKLKNHP